MKVSSSNKWYIPRLFEHWERKLGLARRLEIQATQCIHWPLMIAKKVITDPSPKIDNILAGADDRIASLQQEQWVSIIEHTRVLQQLTQFRLLYQSSPVAYYTVKGLDGTITNVNDAWLKIMGYKAEEVIGTSIFYYIDPPQRENAKARYQARIVGSTVIPDRIGENGEVKGLRVYLKKDGTRIYVDTVNTDHKAEGDLEVLTGFIDITKQVETERRLIRACEQLLLQERLAVIGGTLGMFAHAINNSLTAAIGYRDLAEIILQDRDKVINKIETAVSAAEKRTSIDYLRNKIEQLSEYLVVIKKSNDSIKAIVESILAFSRQRSVSAESRVAKVIREQGGIIKFIPESNKLKYSAPDLNVIGEDINIAMSPVDLLDSILILVKNASDACEYGRGSVALTIKVIEEKLIVSVADTGHGMDQNKTNELLTSETIISTKGERGNAIGVKAVRKRVKEAGGTISIQSELGKGSTFTLEIPVFRIDVSAVPM